MVSEWSWGHKYKQVYWLVKITVHSFAFGMIITLKRGQLKKTNLYSWEQQKLPVVLWPSFHHIVVVTKKQLFQAFLTHRILCDCYVWPQLLIGLNLTTSREFSLCLFKDIFDFIKHVLISNKHCLFTQLHFH